MLTVTMSMIFASAVEESVVVAICLNRVPGDFSTPINRVLRAKLGDS